MTRQLGSITDKIKNHFKQGLIVVILCLLLLPLIQRKFGIIHSKNLNGYFELTPKPEFTGMDEIN